MKKYISRFHYLTQDLPNRSHAEQTLMACQAGVNWIQYRCLTKPDDEMIPEINEVASICDEWGATLILTDHYHLLNRVDAQGVHIEDFDADLVVIREVITDEKTLGASATNIERILALQQSGVVDYCGYGPFAHTDTKPNNFPLLGYKGYRELEKYPITIPVIAVGGILLADVEHLMKTPITGIAVSGAVNHSVDPKAMLKAFYQAV
ncbi:thiamine phosphate synthase [Mucilaginibacter paludis]|uniref:Thiamine monophosphate synthase n=1 Tax=Mucilaginibacter paludis DSM 18603 TaxID=714943 RepID=H1Y4Q3_9SPHI|nr:thiamine phosphate synthase [Mucilaginibacter paludis]EHQ28097.1 thiamine monophosphate synthase [Mucilaginibacter paludis DSM 18603]